jgi:DNA repair exonuclease SbcCD ATPase subunit
MDHMNLSDELRNQLIESAKWGKADITPRLTESTEETVEEDYGKGYPEKGIKPGTKAARKEEEEMKKREAMKDHSEHEDAEGSEELEEAHACPLCASELSEAISEERLLEHLDIVVGLVDRLSQLQEGEEDIDAVIDETLAELLLQNEDSPEE